MHTGTCIPQVARCPDDKGKGSYWALAASTSGERFRVRLRSGKQLLRDPHAAERYVSAHRSTR